MGQIDYTKYKEPRKKGQVFAFLFLIIFAVIFIIPLIWIFLSAFKVDMEINKAGGFLFFPKTWTLNNFKEILNPANKQTAARI